MIAADRQPIIVADAGPLIRLAAAGLLDTLRGLNRRIVPVDRVQDAVVGDLSKPFAPEIAAWIHDAACVPKPACSQPSRGHLTSGRRLPHGVLQT